MSVSVHLSVDTSPTVLCLCLQHHLSWSFLLSLPSVCHLSELSVCLPFSPVPYYPSHQVPCQRLCPRLYTDFPIPVTYGPGSAREVLSGARAVTGAGFLQDKRSLGLQTTVAGIRPVVSACSLGPHPGTHRQMPRCELPARWLSLRCLSVPLV